jgi:DNA modification methylase
MSQALPDYAEFLEAKTVFHPECGMAVERVHRKLFPFQRDIVKWALRKGRAAIFADCGLGKSFMQLVDRPKNRDGWPRCWRGAGMTRSWRVIQGDCLDVLRSMPDESVQCCVTSPPYWGLRDYGVEGQLGLEKTPELYVAKMVEVFREVRRVLRKDGTLWLNLGDSYANNGTGGNGATGGRDKSTLQSQMPPMGTTPVHESVPAGMKAKDLVGIPWLVAFALRTDGWYLRQDIIWSKPNPMPESVTDRCTKAHEYIFLMSKSARYYFAQDEIAEPCLDPEDDARRIAQVAHGHKSLPDAMQNGLRKRSGNKERKSATERGCPNDGVDGSIPWEGFTRNKRTVWEVTTKPYPEAHFATFPPDLIEPCIKAGCPEGGLVLDPFSGAGTTGLVATRLHRNFVGIELNPEYVEMSRRRIERDAPLLNVETGVQA